MAVAETVKTARTKDRMRPLKREADNRRNNAETARFRANRPVHRHQARLSLDQRCAGTAALHPGLRFALRAGVAPAATDRPGGLSPTLNKDRNLGVIITGHEWG